MRKLTKSLLRIKSKGCRIDMGPMRPRVLSSGCDRLRWPCGVAATSHEAKKTMEKRWCNACGNAFDPRPQSPRQAYCPKQECQKARKILWQRAKRRTDADYLENQAEAQRTWRAKNPQYWKNYRESHPAYEQENRSQQQRRNERRLELPPKIAKIDVSSPWPPSAGLFRLIEIGSLASAAPRSWTVLLSPIAVDFVLPG